MIVYEKDDEFTAKVTVFSDICKKKRVSQSVKELFS